MSYLDLLDRIRYNEPDAFLDLTERYGWAVYSVIREKYTDPAVADKIYNDTMNLFYHSLANSDAEDPLEALLCAFAAQNVAIQSTDHRNLSERAVAHMPPEIQLNVQDIHQERKKKKGFWYHLGVLLVLAAILAMLWCIVGMLMDLNFIPYFDLGYSWFHGKIMSLF